MVRNVKTVIKRIGADKMIKTRETIGVCIVCNKKVTKTNMAARKIDGLWLCSFDCIAKFLKEKKKWDPGDWDEVCKLQLLCEDRKKKWGLISR